MVPSRPNRSIATADGRYNFGSVSTIFPGADVPVDTLGAARVYLALSLSVIPVRTDGSKSPRIVGWREFSDRRPTGTELRDWFASPGTAGIGITGGVASGNLVVLDFEARSAFDRWGERLTEDEHVHLARSPVVRTPGGGVHVYVRLPEPVPGARYARTAAGKCLIETRGLGHFVVAPGSPPSCHKTGRPHQVAKSGWFDGQPAAPVPVSVFERLTVHAAELNEYVRPSVSVAICERPAGVPTGDRPGDDFNARVAWSAILPPHGWRACRSTPRATYWTRPGKREGVSATTGFCEGPSGRDLLYVFSASAVPFEPDRAYTRFAAYALLNHYGDYSAAGRALARAGYGASRIRRGAHQ